jgi:aminoglycoside phosphotransferase (APT) family kinase protein
MGAGLSGAASYRVDGQRASFVLEIAAEAEPTEAWQEKVALLRLAASAALAPRVVHVDEERRAVLSEWVEDHSFSGFYHEPRTQAAALAELGAMLRRVHSLPLPAGAKGQDPRDVLSTSWAGLGDFPVPGFARDAVERLLGEEAPPSDRAAVLSHNDVNPTNLIYDGKRVLLLDWGSAGPNDPFYDLASISVFLRMDEPTCRALLQAHEGAPVSSLPLRFRYNRRVMSLLCGTIFLHLARRSGYPGSGYPDSGHQASGQAGAEHSLEATLDLGAFYQGLRSGALRLASAEGQWRFGLALIKGSYQL